MVLCVSLLNLPSTISPTPYATEYGAKHILTTYINALMEAGLPTPRFIFAFEVDEEVGGELPTVTTMNFCTNDGENTNVPCMVISKNSYKKNPKDAPALVMSNGFHAKVVECLKRQFEQVRLVNFGTRGLNGGLAPLFDVPPIDVYHPSAGPKAKGAGALALMRASRGEERTTTTRRRSTTS